MELIANPNHDNPQEAEIARQMMTNPDGFRASAQEFTEKYAKSPNCNREVRPTDITVFLAHLCLRSKLAQDIFEAELD